MGDQELGFGHVDFEEGEWGGNCHNITLESCQVGKGSWDLGHRWGMVGR